MKSLNKDEKFRKTLKKTAKFCQKNARIRDVKKVENYSNVTRNVAVIYYQTLEEFP